MSGIGGGTTNLPLEVQRIDPVRSVGRVMIGDLEGALLRPRNCESIAGGTRNRKEPS